MKRNLIEVFKAARRVSTPLLAISTPDQQALAIKIAEAINGEAPKISWDGVRGLRPMNETGQGALQQFGEEISSVSTNPMEAISMLDELPAKSMVFWMNAHRFIADAVVAQGILNLRDSFKQDRRTFVMLAPSFDLPAELAADVVLLDDPLPDDDELGAVLDSVYQAADFDTVDPEIKNKAVDAARGLSAFGAEQIYAMSLTKEGLDLEDAWERKRMAVNQTKGLSISKNGAETFDSLGGLDAARQFADRLFKGGKPPRAIVRIDEIEKMMAGASGPVSDSSGVSQDALGALLRWMEDTQQDGLIAVGPPGSGKSAFSKAVGATHGIPTIELDLGAMKGSLVGESERAIRESLKVIEGVGGDSVFIIATCNKLDALPPELRRRFRSGIWFFDLPTDEERESIWQIMTKKYNLTETQLDYPDDSDWTGAEIRNCCDLAWRLGCSLKESADYIVPVAKADPKSIENLRNAAVGRWLSASCAGAYRQQFSSKQKTNRAISVD